MSAPHPLPPEVSLLHNLRHKHPTRSYSDLLDAFHLARSIMPEGRLEDLETIASYILEKSAAIEIFEASGT
ncbi:MAG: hypothetical protein EOP83_00460 [Verrucomicrobiaceae bacterium]|nr:MAG: hypothetical protein EOP83_00460 [Verrucomicrobiaceae bacterium]